jgi:hypothetical protein
VRLTKVLPEEEERDEIERQTEELGEHHQSVNERREKFGESFLMDFANDQSFTCATFGW